MPVFITTVLYPNDAKFDLDYYNNKHMPMVLEEWKQFGMTGWKVVKIANDDGKSPYQIQAELQWSKEDASATAFADETAKKILGDIPNFSAKDPLIVSGNQVANS